MTGYGKTKRHRISPDDPGPIDLTANAAGRNAHEIAHAEAPPKGTASRPSDATHDSTTDELRDVDHDTQTTAATMGIDGTPRWLPLASIKPPTRPTRPAGRKYVESLALDIGERGLLSPPRVDTSGVIIAGHHRLLALLLLLAENPEVFFRWFAEGLIPVHVADYRIVDDPDRAVAESIRENVARKNLSHEDALAAVRAFIDAGGKSKSGHPARGEIALRPKVMAALGVSESTAKRLIREVLDPKTRVKPDQVTRFRKALTKVMRSVPKDADPATVAEVQRLLDAVLALFPAADKNNDDGGAAR